MRAPDVSADLWIPLIWLLILGSRPVSLWFSPGGGLQGIEGSPVDATIYLILIVAALRILSKRRTDWSEFGANNRVLIVLVVYMAVSVLWSEDPYVSSKRFIKLMGTPIMALVVLTERDPEVALVTVARRCAYVLLPLSETLNKYFLSLAVSFDEWTGGMQIGGVSGSKNMFGQLCFVEGLLLVWILFRRADRGPADLRKVQWILDLCIASLAIYLLYKSNSSTSLVCFIAGVVVLFAGGLRPIRWRIASLLLVTAIVFVVLQACFGIYESAVAALGRDPTLTDRTEIWRELWALRGNLLVGTGFEGFWMGERLASIREVRHINEAHNGYLEIILNLGLIGLAFWLCLIVKAYKNCTKLIQTRYDLGQIGMALFAVVLLYSFTEAGFKGLSFILFFFFVIAIDLFYLRRWKGIGEGEPGLGLSLQTNAVEAAIDRDDL